ncbi:hypothetical protein LB507_003768, partial [Fusarium sp. FIESC RH6]
RPRLYRQRFCLVRARRIRRRASAEFSVPRKHVTERCAREQEDPRRQGLVAWSQVESFISFEFDVYLAIASIFHFEICARNRGVAKP